MANSFKRGITQHHKKAVYHPAYTGETHLARVETIVIGGRKMAIKFPTSQLIGDKSNKPKEEKTPEVKVTVKE